MALVSRLKDTIVYLMNRATSPRMIHYKKNFQNIISENLRISNTTVIDYSNKLLLADEVFIGHYNFIEASNGIEVEEGVQITNFCTITSHSSHDSIRLYGKRFKGEKHPEGYLKGEIKIGKYTFVGPHSIIMPQTNIGKGSIVTAYSYVQGDFPDFSIIRGNPAKCIGSTKERDLKLLKQYPQLQSFYDEWTKK